MFFHIQTIYMLLSYVICQKEINITVISGNNVTLVKPDNASFQLEQWFFQSRLNDICPNTQLCNQFPKDIRTYEPKPPYCMPLTFMCNRTGLYLQNVRTTVPVTYFLIQQGGLSELPYRNITYNILFSTPPPHLSSITPYNSQQHSVSLTSISQPYANNHIYIVIVFVVTMFCIGLGYLHYRKPLQKRFQRL
ncbi:membrane protein RL11E [macacine betaherpesvirus 3]|nr:membrane protein RL11E [macacine betaherpesvirus 3]